MKPSINNNFKRDWDKRRYQVKRNFVCSRLWTETQLNFFVSSSFFPRIPFQNMIQGTFPPSLLSFLWQQSYVIYYKYQRKFTLSHSFPHSFFVRFVTWKDRDEVLYLATISSLVQALLFLILTLFSFFSTYILYLHCYLLGKSKLRHRKVSRME